MQNKDILYMRAAELSRLLLKKDISAFEITRTFLDRIDSLQPRLNAYITVCHEESLKAARNIDRTLARGNPAAKPLLGIPVALKDQIDTRGIVTTNGSLALKDNIPLEDATVVSKLKRAGAIIIGKLNMMEFAAAGGESPPFGQPRNPWNTAYSTGGSSTGSGIAVSSGMCSVSLGEDSGGSGRIPASYCGVVGFRPSAGLVSRYGIQALSPSLDSASPLGRTVADCALLLQPIAGYDSKDALSSRRKVPNYTGSLRADLRGTRIGVIKEFMDDPNLDPEVKAAVKSAVEALKDLGMSVEEVSIPYITRSMYALGVILWCEGAALNRPLIESKSDLFQQSTRVGFIAASLLPVKVYMAARQAQILIRAQLLDAFRKYDLLLGPTSPKLPPKIEDTLKTSNFPVKEDVVKRHADGHGGFSPLSGCPAISVPCGFSNSGLPIGLQIAGRPFEDQLVLQAAQAYEESSRWYTRRPNLS